MRQAGHTAHERDKNPHKILVKIRRDVGIDGMVKLKWILKELGM
jgi:hypothetical protein